MHISKQKVEESYEKNASYYDLALNILYPLIGLKIGEYRKKAVNYLALKEGDVVIDLGCRTKGSSPNVAKPRPLLRLFPFRAPSERCRYRLFLSCVTVTALSVLLGLIYGHRGR